jgi:hypothetical protein
MFESEGGREEERERGREGERWTLIIFVLTSTITSVK